MANKGFCMMNFKDGDIFTTKDGSRYVKIGALSYNLDTCFYHAHTMDGKHDPRKHKKNNKDIVKVERFETTPDCDYLSQALKMFKGIPITTPIETIWNAVDPRVQMLKDELAKATQTANSAISRITSIQMQLDNLSK